MKPILEIQNISKKFRINHEQSPYLSLRDSITNIFKSKTSKEDFWALKDVSFNVMPGDTVGIIGKNGAGKSTLLKILSKITPPTSGKITSRGRIASLLEVGTGFHPELNGRENIFMNGSILGMRKTEIVKNFDSIVDFAGVEKFIDTPLKHYSSGMQLRLAFAVAAFLENEVLIIDEVLAVGDAEFQKKCMGKMEDVSKSGRTILFVSHNIEAIETLCKNSIFLSNGYKVDEGRSIDIINKYMSSPKNLNFHPIELTKNSKLEHFSLSNSVIYSGDVLKFSLIINTQNKIHKTITDLCVLFYNYKKQRVAIFDCRKYFNELKQENGLINFEGKINSFNLVEGLYTVGLFYGENEERFDFYDLLNLEVKQKNINFEIKPYDLQYRGFVELI